MRSILFVLALFAACGTSAVVSAANSYSQSCGPVGENVPTSIAARCDFAGTYDRSTGYCGAAPSHGQYSGAYYPVLDAVSPQFERTDEIFGDGMTTWHWDDSAVFAGNEAIIVSQCTYENDCLRGNGGGTALYAAGCSVFEEQYPTNFGPAMGTNACMALA